MTQIPRPTITPGNVLYGRPLFRDSGESPNKLGKKEHPVVVLKIVQSPNQPHETLAFVIPMSSSPIHTQKAHSERVRPGLVRGLPPKDERDSYFCPNSPNWIRINGADNGLRANPRQAEGAHPFKHAHIADSRTVERLLATTQSLMGEYKVPIQGESMAKTRLYIASKTPDKRVAVIEAAARAEAQQRANSVPPLAQVMTAQQGAQKRPTLGLKALAR